MSWYQGSSQSSQRNGRQQLWNNYQGAEEPEHHPYIFSFVFLGHLQKRLSETKLIPDDMLLLHDLLCSHLEKGNVMILQKFSIQQKTFARFDLTNSCKSSCGLADRPRNASEGLMVQRENFPKNSWEGKGALEGTKGKMGQQPWRHLPLCASRITHTLSF